MLIPFYLILSTLLLPILTIYCSSSCSANSIVACHTAGPTQCQICDPALYTGGSGVCSATATGVTLVENTAENVLGAMWVTNTVNAGLTCTVLYSGFATYNFVFWAKLVAGDYLYREIALTQPHYQIKFKFSIAFIGVWSTNNDAITLYLSDTLQSYTLQLLYTCNASASTTQTLCNSTLPNAYNMVDCFLNFGPYTYNHNTSKLIFNLSYLQSEYDSSDQFWTLYDMSLFTLNCDISCLSCFGALSTTCYTCADNYYYVNNNTCMNSCPIGMYLLRDSGNVLTGQCYNVCPQGYYVSGVECVGCGSGCLVCTVAGGCLLSSGDGGMEETMWDKYITVWVLLILMAGLLLVGIIYKIATTRTGSAVTQQSPKVVQVRHRGYEQRATMHQTLQPTLQPNNNFHIQQIDFKDNVMVDQPRKRKRVEQDMARTAQYFA